MASWTSRGRVLRLGSAEVPEGVPLFFETVDELENGDWHISGVIELTPRWVTGFEDPGLAARAQQIMAEQRVNVRADQEYVARANSVAAWRLTLLLIVLNAIVSYVLFCLALASNASLPDPNNFWVHCALLPVAAGQAGALSLAEMQVPQSARRSPAGSTANGQAASAGRSGQRTTSSVPTRWQSRCAAHGCCGCPGCCAKRGAKRAKPLLTQRPSLPALRAGERRETADPPALEPNSSA